MAKYLVGDVIKHWRKQTGLTQEELAFGIMDVGNLSRIENGKAMPTKLHLDALFTKLGINPNSLTTIFMTDKMAELQKITDSLDYYLSNKKVDETNRIIAQLENDSSFMDDKLNVQYILAAKAANMINMKESPKTILAILSQALHKPRTEIVEDKLETYFLTKTDFLILEMMAMLYFELGEHGRAITILFGLKKNIEENCVDKIERGQRYPLIIYNLTRCLGLANRHEEVIKLCVEGKAVCLETGYLKLLPDIAINEACARYALGDVDACTRLVIDVSHFYRLCERYMDNKIFNEYVKEQFGITMQ